jgi:type VI secretion system secreted protein VgrG
MKHGLFFGLAGMLISIASPALATPILGAAQPFAVLGASSVTNTGSTTIMGDLGVAPGSSITGTSSISDATLQSTTVSQLAQNAASIAFSALDSMPAGTNLSGKDLGTVGPLTPGVYQFANTAQLTGALLLDFTSNPSGEFVFEIGTTLTLAASAVITSTGGDSSLEGNILAQQSITFDTSAGISCGRAIALAGAVTLDSNTIAASCSNGTDFGSDGFSGSATSSTAVPEPGDLSILAVWLLALLTLRFSQPYRSEIRLPSA